ncbi:hypothetical protein [Micromonospora sp. NPDC005203]|uniref:hypothetical protein n=1 Tax=Micromonospora sp. NPDC005203 TaxID=3364226 RepID=UPI00368294A4
MKDLWGPMSTAVVGIFALVGVGLTVWQKDRTDRRDQWWKRAQWSLDLARSQQKTDQVVGFSALVALASSRYAGRDEQDMLSAVAEATLLSVTDASDADFVVKAKS